METQTITKTTGLCRQCAKCENYVLTTSTIKTFYCDHCKDEARTHKAHELVESGNVTYYGDYKFKVHSQYGGSTYSVDIKSGSCTCPDHGNGHKCKHLRAAEEWSRKANIYERAKAVVENSSTWYNGQNRALYRKDKEVVLVTNSDGILYLVHLKNGNTKRRVQCGYIAETGWIFTLNEGAYNSLFVGSGR